MRLKKLKKDKENPLALLLLLGFVFAVRFITPHVPRIGRTYGADNGPSSSSSSSSLKKAI